MPATSAGMTGRKVTTVADIDLRFNRSAQLHYTDAERAKDLLRGALDDRLAYQRFDEAYIV